VAAGAVAAVAAGIATVVVWVALLRFASRESSMMAIAKPATTSITNVATIATGTRQSGARWIRVRALPHGLPALRQRLAAGSAVAIAAAENGAAARARAADPGRAQLSQWLPISECTLQRPQLGVGGGGAGELGLHQVRLLAPEALQLEHETADVAQLHLAQLAQVPRPSSHPAPLQESGLSTRRGLGRRAATDELRAPGLL
jgi:hypothetical protein